jgi:hypothetical protein
MQEEDRGEAISTRLSEAFMACMAWCEGKRERKKEGKSVCRKAFRFPFPIQPREILFNGRGIGKETLFQIGKLSYEYKRSNSWYLIL